MSERADRIVEGSHTHGLRYVFAFTWHGDLDATTPPLDALAPVVECARAYDEPPTETPTAPPLWVRMTEPPGGHDSEYLFSHVAAFLFSDPKSATERAAYTLAYRLSPRALDGEVNGRYVLALPRVDEGDTLVAPLSFEDGTLYLLQSGIGFLVIEARLAARGKAQREPAFARLPEALPPSQAPLPAGGLRFNPSADTEPLTLAHLVRAHRVLRSTHPRGVAPLLRVEKDPVSRTRRVVDRTRLITLLEGVLDRTLPGTEGAPGWTPFFKRRLLGFVVGVVEGAPETSGVRASLARPLFWLRHGFDSSYRPAPADLAFEGNPEVLQTFDNVVFGLSLEGGAALLVDDGSPFVREQLPQRIRDRYFLLFLIALHQRAGAILMAERIARLAAGRARRPDDETVHRVTSLRNEVLDFKTRGWFADVGTMRMYTEVYTRWRRVLLTDALVEEVRSEVQELDDYLNRLRLERERRREQDERARAATLEEQTRRQSRALEVLSYYLLPVTIVTSLAGINYDYISGHGGWWWLLGAALVVLALSLVIRSRLHAYRAQPDAAPGDRARDGTRSPNTRAS